MHVCFSIPLYSMQWGRACDGYTNLCRGHTENRVPGSTEGALNKMYIYRKHLNKLHVMKYTLFVNVYIVAGNSLVYGLTL